MSGIAYSSSLSEVGRYIVAMDTFPPEVTVQPLFESLAGVRHFGNGLVVGSDAQTILVRKIEDASRAIYPSGQKVESYPN